MSELALAGIGHNQPPEITLADRLKEDHAATLAQIDEIAAKANKSPSTIEDDTAKAAATDIAAEAGKLFKAIDEARKTVKRPYKEAVDAIDFFFRDPLARLDRIDKGLMGRVSAFDRAQLAKARAAQQAAEDEARRKAVAARLEAEEAAKAGRVEDAVASLEDAAHAEAAVDSAPAAPSAAESTRIMTAGGVTASASTEWTFEVTDRAALDLNALRDFIAPVDVDAALKRFVKINKGARQIAGVRFYEDVVTRRRRT